MIYCYIRVSTDHQEFERQKNILKERGYIETEKCKYIEEIYTGTATKRPIFTDLIENKIKENDTLIIESLSRLSRGGIVKTLELISELVQIKKINVYILKENFYLQAGEKPDANTSLLLGIFSILGQFERDLISERTKEALKAKKIKGVKLGRKYSYTLNDFKIVLLYMIKNKCGIIKACFLHDYTVSSFQNSLKKLQNIYNVKAYDQIYECIKNLKKWDQIF